jgi:hypothetical protein
VAEPCKTESSLPWTVGGLLDEAGNPPMPRRVEPGRRDPHTNELNSCLSAKMLLLFGAADRRQAGLSEGSPLA